MIDWLSSGLITFAANAIWGAGGLLASIVCHVLLVTKVGRDAPEYVQESLRWARLGGLCIFAHRAYWNIGLLFDVPGGGPYHPAVIANKQWTIVFVLGYVYGLSRTVLPFVVPRYQRHYAGAVAGMFALVTGISAWLYQVVHY